MFSKDYRTPDGARRKHCSGASCNERQVSV